MEAIGGAIFAIFFLGFGFFVVGGFIFWIFKIIEVAQIPEEQFRLAGTDKVTWVLVVALAGAIGGIIWHFAKRRQVLDSAGHLPGPPPGWYPDPGSGQLRWWDGSRWTDHAAPPA